MPDDVMNKKEAAAFLKMSVSNLDRLMKEQKVPFSRVNGRVLFLKSDLLEWLKDKRVVKPNPNKGGVL